MFYLPTESEGLHHRPPGLPGYTSTGETSDLTASVCSQKSQQTALYYNNILFYDICQVVSGTCYNSYTHILDNNIGMNLFN